MCIERRSVATIAAATRCDATPRCALSRPALRIDSGLHLIVSVVCTRYSTREFGIIFVKPLSAADRVRCAAMNRAFNSPRESRISIVSPNPIRDSDDVYANPSVLDIPFRLTVRPFLSMRDKVRHFPSSF